MNAFGFQSPLQDLLTQYLEYCHNSLTVESYNRRISQLKHFDQYLIRKNYVKDDPVDEALTLLWIHELSTLSSSTVMTYVNALRQFLKFYSNSTGISVFVPPNQKVDDDYVPYLFTDQDMKTIYGLVDNYTQNSRDNPFIHLEFPMIIRLLESCGFRINELVSIRMREVDLNAGIFKMINTKNQKQRLVPLSESMADLVLRYCDAMNIPEDGDAYLFPKLEFSSHISMRTISEQFRRLLVKAGIRHEGSYGYERGPCIHCLRHRFAIRAMRQLMTQDIYPEDAVPYLSIYLGHDSINETEKYLKFSSEMFSEDLDKFDKHSDEMYPDDKIWEDLYGC